MAGRNCRMIVVATVLLTPVTGCGSAPDAADGPDLPPGAPIEFASSPRLAVGVVDGDTIRELDRVVTPFLLPGGELAIPLSEAGTIRIFGPRGEFVRSLGRKGNGPGEFTYLSKAWARGDTIEAFDSDLRRITRFLPHDSVEIVAVRTPLSDLSAPAGPLDDGWAVGGVAAGKVGARDSMEMRRIDRTGQDRGVLAHVRGMLRYRGSEYTGPTPLSPRAMIAVRLNHVFVAESTTPRIEAIGPDGVATRPK
jgi:hypothetical protein